MIQNSKPKSEVFHVAGVSSYGDSLKKLAKLNPDWNLSAEDIVAGGKASQKIFRLKFITRPVELRNNRETGTLDVYVADQILGYIHPNEVNKAKDILKNCEIQNIACGIWGGQCKVVDEFYDVETEQAPLTVNLKIVYTEPMPIDDDFSDMIFDDDIPVSPPAAPNLPMLKEEKTIKGRKQKAKKDKKPFYKRWWFRLFVILTVISLLFGDKENETDTIEAPETTAIEVQQIIEPSTSETVAYVESTSATMSEADPVFDEKASDEKASDEKASVDAAIGLIKLSLSSSLENYEVSYDDGIFTVNTWVEGITTGAMLAAAGDEECLKSWNELVESQEYCCSSLYELVKTVGFSDAVVVLNVLNDTNKDNVLISTYNGVAVYDCVRDN